MQNPSQLSSFFLAEGTMGLNLDTYILLSFDKDKNCFYFIAKGFGRQ